jgi:hypothetical protein
MEKDQRRFLQLDVLRLDNLGHLLLERLSQFFDWSVYPLA